MLLKIFSLVRFNFYILIFLALFTKKTYAQCAGLDNSISICDISNPSNKSINLFSLLGNSAISDGLWKDNLNSGGLDVSTGILNAQKINKSGVYTYTYTGNIANGCAESATITVTIGGYSGISGSNALACSDNFNFNLFQVFNGDILSPQSNGIWTDNDNTGALSGNLLNCKLAGIGTFSFTYTMPAIGSCPQQSSTVSITIYKAPNSGSPTDLQLCNSDNLSLYKNLNLNDLLIGEDKNGKWTESTTNELSTPLDSNINVQNIYNTLGYGVYSFFYTVPSSNTICGSKSSVVNVIIEKQLNFSGVTFSINSDICENEIPTAKYNAILKQGFEEIPDGTYEVIYSIAGSAFDISSNIISNFKDGILQFPLVSSNFQQVDNYTISIKDIRNITSSGICNKDIGEISDVLHIYPTPKINNAILTINSICEKFDAVVEISGVPNLENGKYNIIYNLTGSNSVIAQQTSLSFLNGVATFTIPVSLIPNAGNTTLAITKITNSVTNCTNTSTLTKVFVINSPSTIPPFSVVLKDACENLPILVSIPGLEDLSNFSIVYNLTGVNNATNQKATIFVAFGVASFVIPLSILKKSGITTLSITSIINNNGCISPLDIISKDFTIYKIPTIPTVKDQIFCKTDYATIADLVPNGNQYQWFDSPTNTIILSNSILLKSGDYYVKEVNTISGCDSGKAKVNVVINELQTPTLKQNGQSFCALDNPTLESLTNNVVSNEVVTWYNASSNGAQLSNNELLKEGETYYGYSFSNSQNCVSEFALAVTVSLENCIATKDNFFIPDGFSPNGDGINDIFRIPDIEFIYPNYTLEIFNRYGNLMYTASKSKPNWDGKNSDKGIDGIAPNGIYFYSINFNKDNIPSRQGRFYLNR